MESELPAELIHRIQSFLPEKDAGASCILSKSWLHAWSTIPNLRFHKNNFIDNTLKRYQRLNLPIQSFDLQFNVKNQDVGPLTRWIKQVASKSCLKELSLSFYFSIDSLIKLPDEIFSGENLTKINVVNEAYYSTDFSTENTNYRSIWINSPHNHMIKCVSLRVLKLINVIISEKVFNSLLSTCILLEKIQLYHCNGLKSAKVKDLPRLTELEIISKGCVLELIDNVPSLDFLHYWHTNLKKPIPFNMYQIARVTRLEIFGLSITNDEFFNMIKSKFLFLEDLNVAGVEWGPNMKRLVITNVTLKKLTIELSDHNCPKDLQVNAPKLLFFYYESEDIPTLSFPAIAPKQIELKLELNAPVDISFLLKMGELLKLSSMFDIHISGDPDDTLVSCDTYVDDLRKRVPCPATNVQKLYIETDIEHVRKHTLYYDLLFSICHPRHLKAEHSELEDEDDNRLFSILMVKGIMNYNNNKKMTELKNVQLQNPCNGRWEDLTSTSWKTFDDPDSPYSVDLKLEWFNQ